MRERRAALRVGQSVPEGSTPLSARGWRRRPPPQKKNLRREKTWAVNLLPTDRKKLLSLLCPSGVELVVCSSSSSSSPLFLSLLSVLFFFFFWVPVCFRCDEEKKGEFLPQAKRKKRRRRRRRRKGLFGSGEREKGTWGKEGRKERKRQKSPAELPLLLLSSSGLPSFFLLLPPSSSSSSSSTLCKNSPCGLTNTEKVEGGRVSVSFITLLLHPTSQPSFYTSREGKKGKE